MNDAQLLRYSRQIMLPWCGIEGQERLLAARVLIVGLGGLGSPVALYLAAAGVGYLVLTDDDLVDVTNLQRQILHTTADIGNAKTTSAQQALQALNPDVAVELIPNRMDYDAAHALLDSIDVAVDCSDNFATRFTLNAACVATGTPLVSGAVVRMEGQVSVFPNTGGDAPCYRCLYPDEGNEETNCAETGVLAPLPGIIGSVQATEVLKLLTGHGEPLVGRLLLLDASTMAWRSLKLRRDPACPVCGAD